MSGLTFGSLFSGIGGLDLGLEWAGWQCRWQIESDPFRSIILAKHWPDVPRYGRIQEVDFAELEPVELIAGGFPCQPVSSAGLRQAQSDERWLWPHFARAIRTLRPRFALILNWLVGDGPVPPPPPQIPVCSYCGRRVPESPCAGCGNREV